MVASDVRLGAGAIVFRPELVNLFGCDIGEGSRVGPFVEIQRGVAIGRLCKISSHSFICSGVNIGDGVFIGHGVMFINDTYPAALNADGSLQSDADWEVIRTEVGDRASIGTHATILAGIRIGEGSLIGAGAVVTKDVPAYAIVAGNPARVIGDARTRGGSRSKYTLPPNSALRGMPGKETAA